MALNEEIGKTKEYIKIGSDFKAGDTFDRSNGTINRVTGANQSTVDQRKGNLVKGTELYNIKNSTSIPVASPGNPDPDNQKRGYILMPKVTVNEYPLATNSFYLINCQMETTPTLTVGSEKKQYNSTNFCYLVEVRSDETLVRPITWRFTNLYDYTPESFSKAMWLCTYRLNRESFPASYNYTMLFYNSNTNSRLFAKSLFLDNSREKTTSYVGSTSYIPNLSQIPASSLPNISDTTKFIGIANGGDYNSFSSSNYSWTRYFIDDFQIKIGSADDNSRYEIDEHPTITGKYFSAIYMTTIFTNVDGSIQKFQLRNKNIKSKYTSITLSVADNIWKSSPALKKSLRDSENYIWLICYSNKKVYAVKAPISDLDKSVTYTADFEGSFDMGLTELDGIHTNIAVCESENSLLIYAIKNQNISSYLDMRYLYRITIRK